MTPSNRLAATIRDKLERQVMEHLERCDRLYGPGPTLPMEVDPDELLILLKACQEAFDWEESP